MLDRTLLLAMQTPQGARRDVWVAAHETDAGAATDDLALVEALGKRVRLVEGETLNFKITTPGDMELARQIISGSEIRTGFGYDVHAISANPGRALFLGGIQFPDGPGLEGHSDADVLIHSAVDALLGAAALGDIGQHFANTDERWRGEPSLTFLRYTRELLASRGWMVVNVDIAAVVERPKIMHRAHEMRQAMAEALGIEPDRISVKATTNEGLGTIGRGEGMAAFATATVRRSFAP